MLPSYPVQCVNTRNCIQELICIDSFLEYLMLLNLLYVIQNQKKKRMWKEVDVTYFKEL
jgi:hypothetical protein